MQTENYNINLKHLLKDGVIITKHDSVTRSTIDPTIIATSPNNCISQSINYFYFNHWQPIINNELSRENFKSATIIIPKKEINTSIYYFKGSYDWLLIIFLLLLLLLTWVKISYNKVLGQTFASIINQQSARKLIAEKSNLLQKTSIFLTVIYLFTTGIFTFEVINYYNLNFLNLFGFKLFFVCLICIVIFFLIKNLLYWLSGILFDSESYILEFLNHGNIFYRSAGIIILPIIFAIPYVSNYIAQTLIYIGIFMFVISFILRIVRGFLLSFQNKLSLFYSFLYFCALEILPFLYVYYYIKKMW